MLPAPRLTRSSLQPSSTGQIPTPLESFHPLLSWGFLSCRDVRLSNEQPPPVPSSQQPALPLHRGSSLTHCSLGGSPLSTSSHSVPSLRFLPTCTTRSSSFLQPICSDESLFGYPFHHGPLIFFFAFCDFRRFPLLPSPFPFLRLPFLSVPFT